MSTALRSQLQALSAQHGRSSPALRPAVVQELKAVLQAARTEAESRLLTDGNGTACAENLSLCRGRTHPGALRSGGQDPVPAGSLGRQRTHRHRRGRRLWPRHPGPGSDIDLLFVLPAAPVARGCRASSSSSSTTLWDTRQKVGHATRNIDECIRLAKTDNTILTAILEARYICGDVSALRAPGRRFPARHRGQGRAGLRCRQAGRA